MHVLFVEDDPAEARIMEMMLQMAGHDCDSVDRGQQAVVLARRNDYDVIVLDLMLPDIDGFEVVRRLRDAGIRTPLVIQTGLMDRADRQSARALGLHDYLLKPFCQEELYERIETAISRVPSRAWPSEATEGYVDLAPRHERRRHSRFATLKAAKIVDGGYQLDCVVINMSHGGACLRLANEKLRCPEKFKLKMAGGKARVCERRWRLGDKVGVLFKR